MRRMRVSSLILVALLGLTVCSMNASASTLTDIPGRLADTLDVSDTTAELMISAMILVSISLALTAARAPVIAIMIVLLAVLGVLTAMGWVDAWLMVLAAVTVAALFALGMSGIFGGGSSNAP